jgi:hypothetical protein
MIEGSLSRIAEDEPLVERRELVELRQRLGGVS